MKSNPPSDMIYFKVEELIRRKHLKNQTFIFTRITYWILQVIF